MGMSTIAYQTTGKRRGKKKLLVTSERPISTGWTSNGEKGWFTIRIVGDSEKEGVTVNACMQLQETEARQVVKFFSEYLARYGKEQQS